MSRFSLSDWCSNQVKAFNAAREPPRSRERSSRRHKRRHRNHERGHVDDATSTSHLPQDSQNRNGVRFADVQEGRGRQSSVDSGSISPERKYRSNSPSPAASNHQSKRSATPSCRLPWNKQLEQVMASIPVGCGITHQQYSDMDKSLYDYERDQQSASERAPRKRRDSTHVVTLTLKGDGSLETRMSDRHIVPRKTPRHEYIRRQTALDDGAGSMSSGSSVASSVFSDDQVRYVVRRHHQRVHQYKFFDPNNRKEGEGAGKFIKLEAGLKKVEGARDLLPLAREPYVELTQGREL